MRAADSKKMHKVGDSRIAHLPPVYVELPESYTEPLKEPAVEDAPRRKRGRPSQKQLDPTEQDGYT